MINFILISIGIVLLYLIVILVSFNPEDPSWLQTTWQGPIRNFGGILGAKISDFLFFIFGFSAYVIPLFILFYLWNVYIRNIHITIFIFLFKLVGLSILLLVCCGLVHLLMIMIDNFFYFSSGGIVGSMLCDFILSYEPITYKISFILFLLVGIIDIMIFFNRFFWMILKMIKKQLFDRIYDLKEFLVFKKKCKFRVDYHHNSNKRYIFPLVFFAKMDKFIFTRVYNLIEDLLSYIKLCINKKNYNYYRRIFKRNIFFWRSHYSMKVDKYDEKRSNNLRICYPKKKELQYNTSCMLDLNTVYIINDSNKCKNLRFVDKNVKQCVLPVFKHENTLGAYQKMHVNRQDFIFPSTNLLAQSSSKNPVDVLELKKFSRLLESKLLEYNIPVSVVNIISGPVITRFELDLSPGIKSSRISSLSRDLARVLSTTSVRVVEVIPGTPYVGLDIPNTKRSTVYLGDIVNSEQFKNFNNPLALVLGKDISGRPFFVDLRSMPHLLVAGTTGSGKSVGINAMIVSILYKATPKEVRFIMIDPKILELSIYSGIPHLLKKVITDTQEVDETLRWCISEMEHRYKLMAMMGARNLENYNCRVEEFNAKKHITDNMENQYIDNNIICCSKTLQKLPYIVIIVDEFSDLMLTTAKKIEELVIRLTQKARAAGIHIILATQRPSVNVITGLIKANIPARVAFTVSSKIDSRTILEQSGAESLLGMGDMLYLGPNSSTSIRVHGAFVEDKEICAVVNFWKNKQ